MMVPLPWLDENIDRGVPVEHDAGLAVCKLIRRFHPAGYIIFLIKYFYVL